jgi:hypothetical protein
MHGGGISDNTGKDESEKTSSYEYHTYNQARRLDMCKWGEKRREKRERGHGK